MKYLLLACFTHLLLILTPLYGQFLLPEEQLFIKHTVSTIKVDTGTTVVDDWSSVIKEVDGKRIVLLGEANHGSREIFLRRNELIQALHEQLGFEVILFESGMGELIYDDQEQQRLAPRQLLSAFFDIWRTQEFESLMAYVQAHHLAIAGFDVQRSGNSFEPLLQEIVSELSLDTSKYYNLETRFGQLRRELPNRKIALEEVEQRSIQLIEDYQQLYRAMLNGTTCHTLKKRMLILKTLFNRKEYLRYMLAFKRDSDWQARWAARDSLMAENVIWLKEHLFPDQKIIVIGHNFHTAKYNAQEMVMGEILAQKFGEELYSLGFFPTAGTYFNNYGQAEEMTPADTTQLDIKHLTQQLVGETSFLPIPLQKSSASKWLWDPIISNDTFNDLSGGNTALLAKQYDGIILLKHSSVPVK